MPSFRLHKFAALVGVTIISNSVFAAAFQLYELGTPIIGTAGVGQAVINDASSAYFNPAAMVPLTSSQFMLGAQTILPYTNFSVKPGNTLSGDTGGNAGLLTPGMSLFYSYEYNPCLKFGISFTTPYAGSLNYTNGWVGRYVIQQATFYALNLNPSVAFRVNDWFTAGVGVAVEYMNLQQTTALPIFGLVDGQINVKAENVSGGFNLGALFTPITGTEIGLAYRSQINHNLHGDLTFLRISDTPNTSIRMIMPHNLILSLNQKITPEASLLAEAGWSHWSSMRNSILHVAGYTATTPRDWNDTYRVGLGGRYDVTCNLTLQAGASFDSSPTNTAHRLPDLPMDNQVRAGTGFQYAASKAINIGMSYEYMNMGRARIDNTSSNGTLKGSYWRNFGNFVQASINVAV